MKANMIIIRGLNGKEIRGENWGQLEYLAYTTLAPRNCVGADSYFDLILLVPGCKPIRTDAVFYRGCNCLAVDSSVVNYL